MKLVLIVVTMALGACALPPEQPTDASPIRSTFASAVNGNFGQAATGRDWANQPSESKGGAAETK